MATVRPCSDPLCQRGSASAREKFYSPSQDNSREYTLPPPHLYPSQQKEGESRLPSVLLPPEGVRALQHSNSQKGSILKILQLLPKSTTRGIIPPLTKSAGRGMELSRNVLLGAVGNSKNSPFSKRGIEHSRKNILWSRWSQKTLWQSWLDRCDSQPANQSLRIDLEAGKIEIKGENFCQSLQSWTGLPSEWIVAQRVTLSCCPPSGRIVGQRGLIVCSPLAASSHGREMSPCPNF